MTIQQAQFNKDKFDELFTDFLLKVNPLLSNNQFLTLTDAGWGVIAEYDSEITNTENLETIAKGIE